MIDLTTMYNDAKFLTVEIQHNNNSYQFENEFDAYVQSTNVFDIMSTITDTFFALGDVIADIYDTDDVQYVADKLSDIYNRMSTDFTYILFTDVVTITRFDDTVYITVEL